jgi:hypothetical protein
MSIQNFTCLALVVHQLLLTNQKVNTDFVWLPCPCFSYHTKFQCPSLNEINVNPYHMFAGAAMLILLMAGN